MKNVEIIEMAKANAGIDETVIVHTLPEWNRLGKQIKKGETAVFITKIWKPRKKKEPELDEDGNPIEIPKYRKMDLVSAGFFTEEQVV